MVLFFTLACCLIALAIWQIVDGSIDERGLDVGIAISNLVISIIFLVYFTMGMFNAI